MAITEDAIKVLLEMAAAGEGEKRGHLEVDGPEFTKEFGWPPARVNDAIQVLEDNFLVKVFRQGGGAYDFATVTLTAEGRKEAEEYEDLPTPAPPRQH